MILRLVKCGSDCNFASDNIEKGLIQWRHMNVKNAE